MKTFIRFVQIIKVSSTDMRRQSSDKLHEGGQRGSRKRSSKILRRNMTFDHGREKNEHLNFYSRKKHCNYKLEKILNNPETAALMTKFLQKEYSEENLEFWKLINSFRKQTKKRKRIAKEIFSTFIGDGSYKQVNLNTETRKEIEENLKRCPPTLFDKAQNEIFVLIERDSYVRFCRSPYYWRCCCILSKSVDQSP